MCLHSCGLVICAAVISAQASAADHPRVCGANLSNAWQGVVDFGSSPRVRGKRYRWGGGMDQARIIPACAGQT